MATYLGVRSCYVVRERLNAFSLSLSLPLPLPLFLPLCLHFVISLSFSLSAEGSAAEHLPWRGITFSEGSTSLAEHGDITRGVVCAKFTWPRNTVLFLPTLLDSGTGRRQPSARVLRCSRKTRRFHSISLSISLSFSPSLSAEGRGVTSLAEHGDITRGVIAEHFVPPLGFRVLGLGFRVWG